MFKIIDDVLNKVTMYRLVLYYLIFLIIVATLLSSFRLLPFTPIAILASSVFLVLVSLVTNTVFAKTFESVTNFESSYITALILALIIAPPHSFHDFPLLGWAAVLAMSSKYILALGKKHLFNPVAISVMICAFALRESANWWVGTAYMMPFVLAGGLLVVRKTKRSDLVFSFTMTALITICSISIFKGSNIITVAQKAILDSPILFFAFVMLTEPLTTPPTKNLQSVYGAIVGFLFAPQVHLGPLFTTPEIALVVGNIFSYIVSPKEKLTLLLKDRLQIAPDVYDFIFKNDKKLSFAPGQYLEWTLPQKNLDSRGNRRYFTIASSPTEEDLKIGVKFYPNSSSFKKSLGSLPQNGEIIASQLAGEFTLPKDKNKKLVFIAGGIGITPFRSMVKYLLDTREQRPITLMYSNKLASDIVYRDVFDKARQELGIKTIYTITEANQVPAGWQGKVGFIDEAMIKSEVPDFTHSHFYISGPRVMVTTFESVLSKMGIAKNQIKTDFFPGFV